MLKLKSEGYKGFNCKDIKFVGKLQEKANKKVKTLNQNSIFKNGTNATFLKKICFLK